MIEKATPASEVELEYLGLLQEECAEVIQLVSKVRRFGWESRNPYIPGSKSNRQLLEDEIGDVFAVLDLLIGTGSVNMGEVMLRRDWKIEKLRTLGYGPSE